MLDIQFPDTFRIGIQVNTLKLTVLCHKSKDYASTCTEEEEGTWTLDTDALGELLRKKGYRLTVDPLCTKTFIGRSIADMCAWESKDAFWDTTVTALTKFAAELGTPDLVSTCGLITHIVSPMERT